jgi:hypothetical protein
LRFRSLDGRCPSAFFVLLLDAICGSVECDDVDTEGVSVAVAGRTIARGLELESVPILLERTGWLCRIPIALTSTSDDLHLRSASVARTSLAGTSRLDALKNERVRSL